MSLDDHVGLLPFEHLTNLVQQARRLADRTAFFLEGECVEIGVTEELFTGTVQDPRTREYVEGRFG